MKTIMILWVAALVAAVAAALVLKAIPPTEAAPQVAQLVPSVAQSAPPASSSSSLDQLMWMKHEDALAVVKLILDSQSYEDRKGAINAAAALVTYHDVKCQRRTGKEVADDQLYLSQLMTEVYPQITATVAAPWRKIIDGAGTNGPLAFCLVMNERSDVQRFMKKSN